MIKYMLLLPFGMALLGMASAQDSTTPVTIPILNSHFDSDVLSCAPGSDCAQLSLTGWLCGPNTGVGKLSTVQYPGAPSDGIYVAFIGDSQYTGSILQTLGVNLQANTLYTLKFSVGARADYPFTGYFASLGAGNVTLASSNAATPVGGHFVTDEIVFQSGANSPQLGQPVQIFVKSIGAGQVNIASASLTVTPDTENKQ